MITLDFVGEYSHIYPTYQYKRLVAVWFLNGIGFNQLKVTVYDIWKKRSSCRPGYRLFVH